MPNLSSFTSGVIAVLRTPNEGSKARPKRRVLPFNEAFENLKMAKSSVAHCAAIHSFGKCRKEITLPDANFLAKLDQLNMAHVQTPIKLMPLMLCSSHWEETVYHNALFLDWLSTYGSTHDNQHYENIVVDYQSTVAIHNKEYHAANNSSSSEPIPTNQGSPARVPEVSIVEPIDMLSPNRLSVQERFDKPLPSEPESGVESGGTAESSVLMNLAAFASIEFGVAKLEIMYQDKLRCIAMTSDGWRCPEVIHQGKLLETREILSSSVIIGAEVDIAQVPSLVLCPGHARGDLPRIYAEKWTSFAEQRLPREEAMRKFNAENWMSVQFFPHERQSLELRRPRSASNLTSRQNETDHLARDGNVGANTLFPPLEAPLNYHGQKFDFSKPKIEFYAGKSEVSMLKPASGDSQRLYETRSAENPRSCSVKFSESDVANRLAPRTRAESHGVHTNLKLADDAASKLEPADASTTISKAFTTLSVAEKVPRSELETLSTSKSATGDAIPCNEHLDSCEAKAPSSENSSSSEEHSRPFVNPQVVDKSLVQEINSSRLQRGFVSVFKSADLKLVKIGQPYIKDGDHKLLAHCKLFNAKKTYAGGCCSLYPERVAFLVRLELQNFGAKMTCQHRLSVLTIGEEEHKLWFNVPESVAISSVKMWNNFANYAYTPNNELRVHWAKMADSLPAPTNAEIHALEEGLKAGGEIYLLEHHLLRHKRYSEWIKEAKRSDPRYSSLELK